MRQLTEALLKGESMYARRGDCRCALLLPAKKVRVAEGRVLRAIAFVFVFLLSLVFPSSAPANDIVASNWIADTGNERPRMLEDEFLAEQSGQGGAIGSHALVADNPGVILWDELPGHPPTQVPGGNQTHLRLSTSVSKK